MAKYEVRVGSSVYDVEAPDEQTAWNWANYAAEQERAAPEAKPAPFSLKDTGLSLAQGVVGAGKSLTDVFGAGNAASEALEGTQKYLGSQMTPERQEEQRRRQATIKEAEGKGAWEEIKANLGAIPEAPLQSTAQVVGSLAPYVATGIIGGAAKLLPTTVKIVNAVVGAAQGAGTVKGSIYETVKEELSKTMPPEKAEEQAKEAQSYWAKNKDQILLGSVLGAAASATGAEKLLVKGAGRASGASAAKELGKTVGSEMITEGGQGGQEQAARNIAMQREGYDVPTMRGVAGQAAGDAALGALGAGAVSAVRGRAAPAEPPAAETPTTEAPPRSPLAESDALNAELEAAMARVEARRAQREQAAGTAVPEEGREAATNPLAWMAGPKGLEPEAEVAPEGREQVTNKQAWAAGPKAQDEFRPVTVEDIANTGVSIGAGVRAWADENLVGKTRTEIRALVEQNPDLLVNKKQQRAKLLTELLAPEPAPYEANTQPIAAPAPRAQGEQRPAEPVAPTSGASPVVPTQPDQPASAAVAAQPEPVGTVPPATDAGLPPDGAGQQPPAVTPEPTDAAQTTEAQQAEAQGPQTPEPPAKPVGRHAAILQSLQDIINLPSAPKALKNEAISVMDGLEDADLMETAADRAAVYDWADKFVASAKAKSFSIGESGPAAVALHSDATAELRANNLVGALHVIGQNSTNEVARAVANRLKMLLSRTHVHLHDDLKTPEGAPARGAASADGTHVWLHTKTGMDEETLLHEAVHAASEHVLNTDPAKLTPSQRDAIAELKLLWNAAKQDKSISLSPEATASLSEFVTEGMTNDSLQQALRAKSWKGQNRWSAFKRIVLKMLGITDVDNMRDATIAAMDTIFASPEATSVSPHKVFRAGAVSEQLAAEAGLLNSTQKTLFARMLDSFFDSNISLGTKLRTQIADIAATIEGRINKGGNEREGFDSRVRDSLGRMNPMALFRQAQDVSKMLLAYLEKGSLVKDSTTGLWKIDALTEGTPPAKIYTMLESWGKKHGYNFEQANSIASRILEGVRLHSMRESNRTSGTDFVIHKISKTNAMSADQQIDAQMAEYAKHPELQAISAAMDASRIALVNHMESVGRLSAEQAKEWRDVAGYVPFDRIVEFSERLSQVKKVGSKTPLGVGKLPELVGTLDHPVGNVFDNYMNTLGWMVGQVMNSDARLQTLTTLEEMGHAKRLKGTPRGKPNATYAFIDGEKVYWDLPSAYDAMAFKDLTGPKSASLRFLGQFSNVLRTTVTALPPFALKQVTDDIQRAVFTSGVKNPLMLAARTLHNFPRIAWAEVRAKGHPEMEGLGSYGVTGGFDFLEGKPAASLLTDMGYKPRGKLKEMLHRLEGITRASDFAVRKAIYEQTLAESKGDTLLAQTRAREFINFRRRGSSEAVGALVATIPFFNAYIQGMDVVLRAATGEGSASSEARAHARAMFVSRAAIVTAFSAIYALAKSDDEEYKEADVRTRAGNWFLGNGLKLPVPGELGALFKAPAEAYIEYIKREGTPEEQTAMEAVRTAFSYIFEQYIGRVTPVPQAVKPLLEAFTNHSFLTGRQLEGIHQAGMLPSQRYNNRTSELAMEISKLASSQFKVEVSPIMIDNMLNGYFGSTAAMATMTTDKLLNPDRMDRPMNKWALLSNYMLDPVGTRRIGEFYDEREKVTQLYNTMNDLAKKDVDAAIRFQEEHADELMTYSYVNATLQQLENARAYKTYLNSKEAAQSMTQEERAAAVKETRQYETEMVSWLREAKTMIRKQSDQ